jgi:hypothetical protein
VHLADYFAGFYIQTSTFQGGKLVTKDLWTRLVLPLLFASGLAIFIHTKWAADGFFLNLSAGLIGILITVSYVDWILRRNERQKWALTDVRIASRLRILLNGTLSGIRGGLGFGPEIFDESVLSTGDPIAIHSEIIRIGQHVISPTAKQRIRKLDPRGWKLLAAHLQNAHNGAVSFLNAFQARLSPDQITRLLDLQESLANSLTFYSVFPDLAGVAASQLPETRTPPEILQRHGYESTEKELQRVIKLSKELSDSVAPRDA